MQKEIPSRKILLFDIDTILLRERLGSSYTNAYRKIEDYYCSNDFLHIQGSGYETIKPMPKSEVISLYKGLLKKYPYLDGCIRDIRFADITSNWYNMSDIHETPEFDGTEINKTIDNFTKIDLSSHDDFDIEL